MHTSPTVDLCILLSLSLSLSRCMQAPPAEAEGGVPPYIPIGNKKSEWVFIDKENKHRFGHPGETVIPGAGESWQHVRRFNQGGTTGADDHGGGEANGEDGSADAEQEGAGGKAAEAGEEAVPDNTGTSGAEVAVPGSDKEDELPW